MKDWTIEKILAAATLVLLVVGAVATWSKAFDRIEEHEKRIGTIESETKARNELLSSQLGKIQTSTDYLNWRMDAVTKALEKQDKKR